MDARAVVRSYIEQVVSEPPGLKALILDEETIRIVSVVYTQSELLSKEVVLIDKLKRAEKKSSLLKHLTCVIFIRPTAENIHVLATELRQPRFQSYRLFFSNIIKRTLVEEIAYADAFERVAHIREVYADYYALSSDLLSFGVLPCIPGMKRMPSASSSSSSSSTAYLHNPNVERTVDAVTSIVLALKLNKPDVRFHSSSALCRNIAQRLAVKFDQERSLFDFSTNNPHHSRTNVRTMVLILDRREDPVTPLLNQWTYEAMLHEVVGIKYNRVSLPEQEKAEMKEVVLDDHEDRFYKENRYVNFGQLGSNLQAMVKQYQQLQDEKKNKQNMQNVEDMFKLISNYPEIRRQSTNVNKHVTLTSLLSKRVASMQLLEVSELEQDIACREAQADHRKQVLQIIDSKKYSSVSMSDKLRLIMLYSLRYEERNDQSTISLMCDKLQQQQGAKSNIQISYLVDAIKVYAGAKKRSSDLFNNRSFFAVASNSVRRGIGGVENVYTQHEPLLVHTVDCLFRGRLKNEDYPLIRPDDATSSTNSLIPDSSNNINSNSILSSSGSSSSSSSSCIMPCRQVIIVMAGGATYEESKCISAINNTPHAFVPTEGSVTASAAQAARLIDAKVILAGTWIHNSTSFGVEITQNAYAVRDQQQEEEHFVKPSR